MGNRHEETDHRQSDGAAEQPAQPFGEAPHRDAQGDATETVKVGGAEQPQRREPKAKVAADTKASDKADAKKTSSWTFETPGKDGLAPETKLGLGLILVLCIGLGFVFYRKMDSFKKHKEAFIARRDQSDDPQTAAPTASTANTGQPAGGGETFSPLKPKQPQVRRDVNPFADASGTNSAHGHSHRADTQPRSNPFGDTAATSDPQPTLAQREPTETAQASLNPFAFADTNDTGVPAQPVDSGPTDAASGDPFLMGDAQHQEPPQQAEPTLDLAAGQSEPGGNPFFTDESDPGSVATSSPSAQFNEEPQFNETQTAELTFEPAPMQTEPMQTEPTGFFAPQEVVHVNEPAANEATGTWSVTEQAEGPGLVLLPAEDEPAIVTVESTVDPMATEPILLLAPQNTELPAESSSTETASTEFASDDAITLQPGVPVMIEDDRVPHTFDTHADEQPLKLLAPEEIATTEPVQTLGLVQAEEPRRTYDDNRGNRGGFQPIGAFETRSTEAARVAESQHGSGSDEIRKREGMLVPADGLVPSPAKEQPAPSLESPRDASPFGFDAAPAQSATDPQPQPTSPFAGMTSPAQEQLHTVGRGENLWSISKKSYGKGRYFSALAKYNEATVPNPNRLKPGTQIRIPTVETLVDLYPQLLRQPATGTRQTAKVSGDRFQPASGYFVDANGQPSYRVGEDDTLTRIALRQLGRSSRWTELYQLNRDRLKSPDTLKIDTVLRLPADCRGLSVAPQGAAIR